MTKPSTARDHADKARDLLDYVNSTYGKLSAEQYIQLAQVHATLAVAEAARTANYLTAGLDYSVAGVDK